jgi:uncharacterized phiE125 gp8 family phage protein
MTIPLSVIKSALRIDFDYDDTQLVRLRESALSLIEKRTQLALSPSTRTLYLASWTDCLIPVHPFISFTGITYYDALNVVQTMPSTSYWIDWADGPMPMLRFIDKPQFYKGTQPTVTYVAGYSSLPNELIHAAIALVGYWYKNPDAADSMSISSSPFSLEYIIDSIGSRSMIR